MVVRKSQPKDFNQIMKLINDGKKIHKAQGNSQWLKNYPNQEVIQEDIRLGNSYVQQVEGKILGTFAIVIGSNPLYDKLYEGKWLTQGKNYANVHRMAIDLELKGKGFGVQLMEEAEKICRQKKVDSIRGQTSPENKLVIKSVENFFGYTRCGKLINRGRELIAYEKILPKPAL